MKVLEKIKILYQNFKGLSTIGTATLISSGLGALFWFYMASAMGADAYGQISYFIAIAIIGSRISLLGLGNTMMVYTAKGVKIQAPIYLIAILGSIITSLILFFVFLYDVGISLYVIGFVVFTLIISDLLGRKQYKSYAKCLISQKIILIILAVSLYHVIGLTGVILGIAISFLPYSFVIYNEFKKSKIDFSLIRSRGKFITNNYVNDLTHTFNGQVDKLIVAPMLGFALLGNYQLAIQFFMILTILPTTVFQYILPHDASGNANLGLKKWLVITAVLFAILGIIIFPIISTVFFPEYEESIPVIQIISIAIIPFTITTIYNSKFLGLGNSKIVLVGSLIFLGVLIPLIIILGDIFMLEGVGLAMVLGYTGQSIYLTLSDKFLKSGNKLNQNSN